ncbi:MAG: alpha-L-fucosidase [Bacteroidetes bacterium]|nr:alpha-L-fucosidase [Bacteroidota bacterium]
MTSKPIFIILLLVASTMDLLAQHHEGPYFPETDTMVLEKLDQWQNLKFGLLMHWGPYSQWGVVESWSICAEDEGWCRRNNPDYIAYKRDYENLKTTFNPVKFEPERWAEAARSAGMKYVVFTTKHHDGFCMFDTKYTDYKVTDPGCPFSVDKRSNITLEIFDAFRKEGLWTGAYFSKPDWHCEYYWWPNFATPDRNVNYDIKAYSERWENYIEFTHNQLLELVSDYGKVDILWLDGGWVRKKSDDEIRRAINSPDFKFTRIQNQDIRMDELVQKVRQKQPGIIVVDRAVPGINQNYLTPENQVPEKMLPYPWESCIIAGGSWSWVPNAKYMSGRKVVHLLVDIVAKGGNLLLNIAPGPDGTWDPGAYDMLRETGEWMKLNSEAIYGTRPLYPYKEGKICLTRKNDGRTFLIYLADEGETDIPKVISLMQYCPEEGSIARLVGSEENLSWEKNGEGCVIHIPDHLTRNPYCLNAWAIEINQ